MTAPETPVTDPTPEAERIILRRDLPANVTDRAFMDAIAQMEKQLRDAGTPPERIRTAAGYYDDGRVWLVAWQAHDDDDWDIPAPTFQ